MTQSPKPKPARVACRQCGVSWEYADRRIALGAVTQKCFCFDTDWSENPFTLAAWWRDELLFDHTTGEGVEDCRREVAAKRKKK